MATDLVGRVRCAARGGRGGDVGEGLAREAGGAAPVEEVEVVDEDEAVRACDDGT